MKSKPLSSHGAYIGRLVYPFLWRATHVTLLADVADALEDRAERDMCFQTGQWCAEAEVDAETERDVLVRVSIHIKYFGMREFGRIAIR